MWRMLITQCTAYQKDANMSKVTTPKMTNMLEMCLFQWWHQIPLLASLEVNNVVVKFWIDNIRISPNMKDVVRR